MKIMSSTGPSPPAGQAIGRSHPNASFAELMERGDRASALLARRALGFSEAGLLGVHFAHDQRALAPAPGKASLPVTPTDVPTEQALDVAQPQAPRPRQSLVSVTGRGGATTTPSSEGPLASSHSRSGSRAAASAVATPTIGSEPVEQTPTGQLKPGRLRPPEPRAVPQTSAFRIRLGGDGSELIVVVDGYETADGSISNLEETAHRIVSDYGMTVKYLIVRSNNRNAKV